MGDASYRFRADFDLMDWYAVVKSLKIARGGVVRVFVSAMAGNSGKAFSSLGGGFGSEYFLVNNFAGLDE